MIRVFFSVRSRLESDEGMNYTEFSYQLFQAYDWLHLSRQYNCRLQVCHWSTLLWLDLFSRSLSQKCTALLDFIWGIRISWSCDWMGGFPFKRLNCTGRGKAVHCHFYPWKDSATKSRNFSKSLLLIILLQIGGNDQIGNMAAGYELVKKITDKSVYGTTKIKLQTSWYRITPLIHFCLPKNQKVNLCTQWKFSIDFKCPTIVTVKEKIIFIDQKWKKKQVWNNDYIEKIWHIFVKSIFRSVLSADSCRNDRSTAGHI